jgi:AcrR family transcriptional regulator
VKPSPGRPRAVDAEERLARAAVEIYGADGWSGLSIASVAQRAGTGKSSVYLRWETKGDLLVAALERYGAHVQDVDLGSMRSDLIALSVNLLRAFDGPAGLANRRLQVDAAIVPELREVEQTMRASQVAAAREIVQRGVSRKEIAADAPVGLLLNAVCGGVINYASTNPSGPVERSADEAQQFAERLVDVVLRGISSETQPSGS